MFLSGDFFNYRTDRSCQVRLLSSPLRSSPALDAALSSGSVADAGTKTEPRRLWLGECDGLKGSEGGLGPWRRKQGRQEQAHSYEPGAVAGSVNQPSRTDTLISGYANA